MRHLTHEERRAEWRATSALLNLVLAGCILALVWIVQPPKVVFDGKWDVGLEADTASLSQRFDCWTDGTGHPIPGGALVLSYHRNGTTTVRHTGDDAVVAHLLNHLGSRHLAAFCAH